MLAINEVAN